MIFVTALTFLLVGYVLGLLQRQPDLPQRAYKQANDYLHPGKVGAIKRPDAARLSRKANPELAAEEDAMKQTLDEIL